MGTGDTSVRGFGKFGGTAGSVASEDLTGRADPLVGQTRLSTTATADAPRARVGEISFVNCLPITLPLVQGLVPMDADVSFAAPSVLNSMFANSKLDVGAMSSFYYLSQSERLKLLPEVSIACSGPVGSVLLFSKRELSDLHSARVVGSAQSATSVNLLKVLLKQQFGLDVTVVAEETPDLNRPDVDAALVIGDRALEVDEEWSRLYLRRDLGQWWVESYDLPMVFGVWAAMRSWVHSNPDAFVHVSEAHLRARFLGLNSQFSDVVGEAAARTNLSATRLESYFKQELDFNLSSIHLRGLELFRKLCSQMGLL